ncbi:MAG TPA: hypothetical protein VJ991_14960 [Balneolales bacterium]|nr:hypothetical protein [Balneolales bacterium]
MASFFILIQEKQGQKPFIHGIFAVIAGIFTLIWPNWLYMLVGGFFLLWALLTIYFKGNSFLAASSAVAGIFILIYPELIPVTFALFMIIFGIISILTASLTWLGVFALLIALILFMHPGSIAYLAGLFLLIYGLRQLFELFQQYRNDEADYPFN